jgi:phage terminase small subunit
LTPRQKRFIEEYLVSLNATQAYAKVYEVSDAVASANGARLLGNAKILAEIAKGQSERSKRTEITADAVLRELWDNALLAKKSEKFADSNRALELCDKHLGALTERLHITTDPTEATNELAELLGISPAELRRTTEPRLTS